MHPLNTVKGAITTAFVLAVIISIGLTMWSGMGAAFHPVLIDRWLHIVSGVMWIGLLYYFNVVQTPGLAAAAADKGGPGGAGITKYIAPRLELGKPALQPRSGDLVAEQPDVVGAHQMSDPALRS